MDLRGGVFRAGGGGRAALLLPRMQRMVHPAVERLLRDLPQDGHLGQVRLGRLEGGRIELRHAQDAGCAPSELRPVSVAELRALAQWTERGVFRPLHAAPDLRAGWRCEVAEAAELEAALEHLYPGFLADWWAVQTGPPPVTDYQAFTARQSGMYRLTAKAAPAQAAEIISACCAPRFCLKQRLWTSPGLAPDGPGEKSLIPCLEPCAVLLEFARKRMRISQEPQAAVTLTPTEARGLLHAVQQALAQPPDTLRVADFGAPENPRHLECLRRKLLASLPAPPPAGGTAEED